MLLSAFQAVLTVWIALQLSIASWIHNDSPRAVRWMRYSEQDATPHRVQDKPRLTLYNMYNDGHQETACRVVTSCTTRSPSRCGVCERAVS
jgi:hypothetical protein